MFTPFCANSNTASYLTISTAVGIISNFQTTPQLLKFFLKNLLIHCRSLFLDICVNCIVHRFLLQSTLHLISPKIRYAKQSQHFTTWHDVCQIAKSHNRLLIIYKAHSFPLIAVSLTHSSKPK